MVRVSGGGRGSMVCMCECWHRSLPYLQLVFQSRGFREKGAEHVRSDRHVGWEKACLPDHEWVAAILTLVAKEPVLSPVCLHIL